MTNNEPINAALRVAKESATAALRLIKTIESDGFRKVVEACLHCKGAVTLIGMGKSGHVGRKISATLNSTGTLSNFIHAAEALHGDMGAIRKNDICLLLSKSGETQETITVSRYLKKQKNMIVAITGNTNSTLADSADVVLDIVTDNEACPMNLAPMISTTATLVLGDALASALIEARGFKPENFAKLHPGGKLGWLLTATVADIISDMANPVCDENTKLRSAILVMVEKRLGGVNVTSADGRLVGVLTDGDLKRLVVDKDNGWLDEPISKFMIKNPTVIKADRSAEEALDLMENRENQISVLPVIDSDGKPVALLRLHDIIKSQM